MKAKERTIGLVGAVAIGIGGMVGGGIFAVLGEAVSIAHGATAVAFSVGGIVALLSAYSYAKLSVAFPSRGGTVIFIDTAFNHNLLSGSVNLLLWLSYLVTISLYAVAFASYALTFFHGHSSAWLKHLLISSAILLPAFINLINASAVSRSETVIVLFKLILLVVIIVSGTAYIDPVLISPAGWGSPFSIITAGMVIFVAYEGFELIANAAEEIKEPGRNLPRAYFVSVFLVLFLYVLIALITVGSVPESQILTVKDYALAVAAKPALGQTGFTIVAVAALLATFSAINATIYGNARLGYILAKEGEIPEEFDKMAWNRPIMSIMTTVVISLLLANLIDLREIAIIASAGFLLIFTIVNAGAYRLAERIGGRKFIFLLALLFSFGALLTLLVHTFEDNPRAVFVFLSFIAAAVLFELSYGCYYRRHFLKRRYGQNPFTR
jgi:amino acid transporter